MASPERVLVVGGGPVGALAALYAARRGYRVELYELRDDPNYGDPGSRPDIAVIPLALSERGIRAIHAAGVPNLIDDILTGTRPIHTRLIHTRDAAGRCKTIPMVYGPQGQCLHTIPREKITKHVLLALMKEPMVKLFFSHRLSSCDFEKQVATFEPVTRDSGIPGAEAAIEGRLSGGTVGAACTLPTRSVHFDFLIGADGSHSGVWQMMMRKQGMDFSQEYLEALWCDFVFPPAASGDYRMDSTCLHLWPADENIVMSQPDMDGSFRAGMICEKAKVRHFEANPEGFANFFDHEFPGIIPDLLSADEVTRQFVAHQKIPLRSVKCGKLGYRDRAVLLGDSAHTMTPFHAMGMITGLEDVRIFFEGFRDPAARDAADHAPFCPPGTVDAYTAFRLPDVHAMVDMAAEHYRELRIGVRSPAARAKKIVEACLSRWLPWLDWTTLYARVQFGHERFTVVRAKEARQTLVMKRLLAGAVGFLVLGATAGVSGWWMRDFR